MSVSKAAAAAVVIRAEKKRKAVNAVKEEMRITR